MTKSILIKTTKIILVVFCVLQIYSCKKNKVLNFEVIYDAERAIAVSYSSKLATEEAKIFLSSNKTTPVLGDYNYVDEHYIFEPVIPFNSGSTYVIYQNDKLIKEFTIKNKVNTQNPELIAIFPSSDTVPENLLKMYFQFSKPMQEVVNALDYISVTDNATGKKVDIFLDLETELWNKEHTLLTLWLDPGRIKTDLIPNKTLGLPILNDHNYTLRVDKNWKDAEGIALKEEYTKEFQVINRDLEYPKVTSWDIQVTPEALTIHFNESLDAILAQEVFRIKDKNGDYILGDYEVAANESILKYYPEKPLKKGEYILIIESKLEDLAGNNLNHPFDKDLTQTESKPETELKTLLFSIE